MHDHTWCSSAIITVLRTLQKAMQLIGRVCWHMTLDAHTYICVPEPSMQMLLCKSTISNQLMQLVPKSVHRLQSHNMRSDML